MQENSSGQMEKEKRYKKLRLDLEALEKKKEMKVPRKIGVIVGVLSSAFLCTMAMRLYFRELILLVLFISIAIGWVAYLLVSMIFDMKENRIRRKLIEYEMEQDQEKVEEDIFENSIKMSYKYLDQYYLQTKEQAHRGFFVTVSIAVFGASLIGLGIVAMFVGKVTPSYITCAAGVISELISTVFFYLYNKTISSMSKYHNKLVLSQNISIALKVSDTLPEEDSIKAKNVIINELLKDINVYLTKSDIES